jgi:hypothetical protein
MPPRWVTGAVIVFWLATTGWMVYRERQRAHHAGEPPPFFIDLTDEVGANVVSWNLFVPQDKKDEKVGLGTSRVHRRADRTFELHSDFSFTNATIMKVVFKKVTSMYRVTADGELKGLALSVHLDKVLGLAGNIEVHIFGDLEQGLFSPTVEATMEGVKIKWPGELPKIKLGEHGSLVNPMHLVSKMKGLSEGQQWTVPGLELDQVLKLQMDIPTWHAEVTKATLLWRDQQESCFRIDYRVPDGKVAASTWVREHDGLVLRKEAEYQGKRFVLERDSGSAGRR